MSKIFCPKCKSKNVVPILYGYPSHEAFEASERGELKLGGCIIERINGCKEPDRYCNDCAYEWSTDNFLAEDITKVRFKYWSNWGVYDPESDVEEQWSFDIFEDGKVKYNSYPRASRRVLDKISVQIEQERVVDFYWEIIFLSHRIKCKRNKYNISRRIPGATLRAFLRTKEFQINVYKQRIRFSVNP